MSSASNTFEQRTRFHIVTMVMLKYVKREARPSYKPSNLSQQNIEAAQKSDADAINQQQTNLSGISVATTPTQRSNVQGSEYL